jgi:hypothetical protein
MSIMRHEAGAPHDQSICYPSRYIHKAHVVKKRGQSQQAGYYARISLNFIHITGGREVCCD